MTSHSPASSPELPKLPDLVAYETPIASDNGACVQPASGEVAEPVLEYSAEDVVAENSKGFLSGFEKGREYERAHSAPASPQAPAPQAYPVGVVMNRVKDGVAHKVASLYETGRDLPLGTLLYSPAPSAASHQGADALREALRALVENEGLEAFVHLDKGVGTSTASGKRWLAARAALAQHQASQQGEQQ